VFIVTHHGLFRSGVRMELGTDVDVIGEAATWDSAVEQIGAQEPDVVLLDVHLPGGGGRPWSARSGRPTRRSGSWPCPRRTRRRT
jgi:DNA-binding NarL/FixJ family response regulator